MQKNPSSRNRRSFMKKSVLSGAGIVGVVEAYSQGLGDPKAPISGTILFQGDSITDAGRDKASMEANDFQSMGLGYAVMASAGLIGGFPGENWKLYNRGISGNKVPQLDARWDEDCLNLKPDVVSILIGVNDYWHTFTGDYKGTVASYEKDYDALLTRTKASLPNVKFILGEPFALKEGSAIRKIKKWYPNFYEYQAAAKRVAEKHQTAWIPYQQIFDDACMQAPYDYWGPDGVHPSFAGRYLMAKSWVETYMSLYP